MWTGKEDWQPGGTKNGQMTILFVISAYHIGQAFEMKLIVIYKVQHEIEAKIVSIATGAEFSVLLDNKGKVLWLDKHYYGPHVLQEFI